jgi:hypothetical protein
VVDITQAFHNRIKAGQAVVDIVGNKIFNDALPQPFSPPAVVFWAQIEDVFFDLESAKAIAISQVTMTCRCYGIDRTGANNLAFELWRHLDGWAGVESGVLFKDLSRDGGTTHIFDEVSGGTDQRRFISQLDFVVTYDSMTTFPPAGLGHSVGGAGASAGREIADHKPGASTGSATTTGASNG